MKGFFQRFTFIPLVFFLFRGFCIQAQIHVEDFEDGVGYTAVEIDADADNFFQRKAANDAEIDQIANPVDGVEGTSLWAVGGLGSTESSLTIDDINISGYSSLNIDMLIAANEASVFEIADYLILEVDFDNSGSYTIVGAFYGVGNPDTRFRQDADLSGASANDNISFNLSEMLTNKNFTIAGTGTLLDIRIRVLNSQTQEQIVFDNIRLNGTLNESSFTPTDGSIIGPTLSNLSITYPENVVAGSAGTLTLTRTTGGAASKAWDIAVAGVGNAGDFSGFGTGTITLDLSNDGITIADGDVFEVDLDAGIFESAGGSPTAAIVGSTDWSFSIDGVAPVFSAVAPTTSSEVNSTQVSYTLDENLASGTITFTRTGGTADGSSPHVVNLTGGELTSGTKTDITLTNNPTLVDGTIYTVEFDGEDAAGNTATTVASTGVTYDFSDPTISAVAPTTGSFINGTEVSYTLDENLVSGTITFTRTGGTADGSSPHIVSLTGSELTSGTKTDITLTNDPALVDGTIYTIEFDGEDAAGNTATTVTSTGVTYDVTDPTISSVAPASSSTVNSTEVTYTLDENLASGTIIFTRTGGTADGSSPHTVILTGSELTSGTKTDITLTNDPTLVDGAIYTIEFDGTDPAGNTATTITSTNVTYDFTPPGVTNIERQSPTSSPTNADQVFWDITFDGVVSNVTADDFNVSGTTADIDQAIDQGGNVYRLRASGGNLAGLNATITLQLATTDIQDAAGNVLPNITPSATDERTFVIDNNGPASTATYSFNRIANGSVQTITLDFGESLTGTPQISINGSTSGNIVNSQPMSGGAQIWTYNAGSTWAVEETYTITVSTATDAAGNSIDTSPSNDTFVVDNTAPQATVNPGSNPIFTGNLVQVITVDYGEDMNTLGSGPTITFSGGAAFTSAGDGSWTDSDTWTETFNKTGAPQEISAVIAVVADGSGATDLAGNSDLGDDSPSFVVDTQRPTLGTPQYFPNAGASNDNRDVVIVQVSEEITLNGSSSPFPAVTINNSNTTDPGFHIEIDGVRRNFVTGSGSGIYATAFNHYQNDNVTRSVGDPAASTITSTRLLRFEGSNSGEWDGTESPRLSYVINGGIVDLAGNQMATTLDNLSVSGDSDPPEISGDIVLFPNGTSPETIEITFNEIINLTNGASVTGFSIADLSTVTYVSATNTVLLTSNANGVWDLTDVVTYTNGTGNVEDGAANELASITINSTATSDDVNDLIYETDPPALVTLTLVSNNTPNNLANGGDQVTLTFTTDDGLNVGSISLSNLRSGGTLIGDQTHTFSTTGTNEYATTFGIDGTDNNGTFSFNLTFNDEAGNAVASTVTASDITGANVVVDNTSPTVNISSNDPDAIVRNANNVLITATFTEANDIDEVSPPSITIGTLVVNAPMTLSSNLIWTYNWNVPAGNDGNVPVSISAADAAGNNLGTQSGQTSFLIDNVIPNLSFTNLENGTQSSFEITFNEELSSTTTAITNVSNLLSSAVNDFGGSNDAIDVSSVPGSVVWDLSTSTSPVATITIPASDFVSGQIVRINFVNGVVMDIAGNPISSATNFDGIIVDTTPPVLAPDEMSLSLNAGAPETIQFSINEELNVPEGFDFGSTVFTVNTGSVATAIYTGKGSSNTITLTSTSNGIWTAGVTTVSYTAGTGVQNLAGLNLATITNKTTVPAVEVTLTAGDIAFSSYSEDGTQTFSFVLLKDIAANSAIKFTDNGWRSDNAFSTNETTLTWTATQDLFAGTEISISGLSASAGSVTGNALIFSNNFEGDQVLAYQGNESNPTFLAAINWNDSDWFVTLTSASWSRSVVPIGLTDGVNALHMTNSDQDNAAYIFGSNITSGSVTALRAALNNNNNWNDDESESNVTFPTGDTNVTDHNDLNYSIPPDITSLNPVNGGRVIASTNILNITFDDNITQLGDLSGGGDDLLLKLDDGSIIGAFDITSASINGTNSISIDISSVGSLATSAQNDVIYEVDLSRWVVKNADGNHNFAITGDGGSDLLDWKFTADGRLPTVTSITRKSVSNPSIDVNNVIFEVTFSENVNGITTNDFSTINNNLIGSPSIASVSAASGTVFDVEVTGIDLNPAFALGSLGLVVLNTNGIADDVGNVLINGTPSTDQGFQIINPTPTDDITNLSSPIQSSTSITLNWTNSTNDQVAHRHLILIQEPGGSFPPSLNDGVFIADEDFSGTTFTTAGIRSVNTLVGESSKEIVGLTSGTSYQFRIYPYTNDGTNVLYQDNSPGNTTAVTTTATTASITSFNGSAIAIPSIADTQPEGFVALSFTITDDPSFSALDNIPTRFTDLTVSRELVNGFDDLGDWTDALEGAELYHSGSGTFATGSISPNNIVFSSIPNVSNTDLGFVSSEGSKSYTLRIWLKNPLLNGLSEIIDGLNIVFDIDADSDVTLESALPTSQFAPSVRVNSGETRSVIEVQAIQFVYNDNGNPILPNQGGRELLNFTNGTAPFPAFEARDANGNLDLTFLPSTLNVFAGNGVSGPPITINNSFINGILDLSASEFGQPSGNTLNETNGTITIENTGITPSSSTSINVIDTEVIEITDGVDDGVVPFPSNGLNKVLLGFQMSALSSNGSLPNFEGVTVRFRSTDPLVTDINLDSIYTNIRLFRNSNPNFVGAFSLTNQTNATVGQDFVNITGISELLDNDVVDQNFFIVADISSDADIDNGQIVAFIDPADIVISPFSNDNVFFNTPLVGDPYSFIDASDPEIAQNGLTPANLNLSTPTTTDFTIEFTEGVSLLNPGAVVLRRIDNPSFIEPLTLDPGNSPSNSKSFTFFWDTDGNGLNDAFDLELDPEVQYYITIQPGAEPDAGFVDESGRSFAGIIDNSQWLFQTADVTPPVIVSSIPVGNKDDESFTFEVEMNETGVIRYVVLDHDDGAYVTPVTPADIQSIIDNPSAFSSYYLNDGEINISAGGVPHIGFQSGLSSGQDFVVFAYALDDGLLPSNNIANSLNDNTGSPGSSLSTVGPLNQAICVGEYQSLITPIIIKETDDNQLSNGTLTIGFVGANATQFEFNTDILTPYDDSEGGLTIESFNYNSNQSFTIEYSATSNSEREFLLFDGLEVKVKSTGATGILELIGSNTSSAEVGNDPFDLPIATFTSFTVSTPVDFEFYEQITTIDGGGNESVQLVLIDNNSIGTAAERVLLLEDASLTLGSNIYEGNAVFQDNSDGAFYFYPNVANVGSYDVNLTHITAEGCSVTDVQTITVFDSENAIEALLDNYCTFEAADIDNDFIVINQTHKPNFILRSLSINIDEIDPSEQANLNDISSILIQNGNDWEFYFHKAARTDAGTIINREGTVRLNFIGTYQSIFDASFQEFEQSVNISENPLITDFSALASVSSGNSTDYCEDDAEITLSGSINTSFHSNRTENINLVDNSLFSTISDFGTLIDDGAGRGTVDPQAVSDEPNLGDGTYTYLYKIRNNVTTCSDSTTLVININPKPTANFSLSNACFGEDVQFTNESIGTVVNSQWEFDDVISPTSNLENPTHAFSSSGNFDVNLRVSTNVGCFDIATQTVEVGAIPQTEFNYTGVNTSDSFEFTSTTPDPSASGTDNIDNYFWDFGDGDTRNTVSETVNNKIYSNTFVDSVRLTVTTTLDCESTLAKPIAVLDKFDPITTPSEAFENGTEGWLTLSQINNSWRLSDNNADIDQDGNTLWVTNPNDSYLPNEISFLYSPTFDFSSVDRPLVSFDAYWDMVNGGVLLQYSVDNLNIADPAKEWLILGTLESGEDWYNRTELSLPTVTTGIAWSDSVGLAEPRHVLDQSIDESNRDNVNFRFAFLSQDADPQRPGFAFDNFVIGERTRTVLLENFTNTSGSAATRAESDFLKTFDVEDDLGTVLVKINYHTDFPGEDPLNEANKIDPSARALFYDITETPTAVIDGTITDSEGRPFSQWGQTSFDLRSLILAEFEIDVTVTSTDGTINIEAIPTPQNNSVLNQELIIMAAVLEKEVLLNDLGVPSVPSGETDFEFVLRKLLPNAAGVLLNTEGASSTIPMDLVSFSWTPSNVVSPSNLAVVVVVQDQNTKEVYQSELLLDIPDPGPVTGMDSDIAVNLFNFYPNPANDRLNVLLSDELVNSTLRMYDNFGKVVYQRTIEESTFDIGIRDYASGMYHIELSNDDNILRKRLIISHSDK